MCSLKAWTYTAIFIRGAVMFATNVRNLKRNPSEALRHAKLEPALAASLFKDRVLSLGAAAQS